MLYRRPCLFSELSWFAVLWSKAIHTPLSNWHHYYCHHLAVSPCHSSWWELLPGSSVVSCSLLLCWRHGSAIGQAEHKEPHCSHRAGRTRPNAEPPCPNPWGSRWARCHRASPDRLDSPSESWESSKALPGLASWDSLPAGSGGSRSGREC